MNSATLPLTHKRIALSETRELDVLYGLLERRGATVLRFPLVSIHPTANTVSVKAWIERFIAEPPEWFILLTGEGLHRLLTFCSEHKLDKEAFVLAMQKCKIISRGPKPAKVLKTIGLVPTMLAESPTTSGVIASLKKHSISHKKIAVQLYGSDPNLLLVDFLDAEQALADYVAPYVYASAADKAKVIEFIELIENKEIDVVVFTSKSQVDFLYRSALKENRVDTLTKALNALQIAAVGPIVSAELSLHQVDVDIMPTRLYFMKPLVTSIVNAFK